MSKPDHRCDGCGKPIPVPGTCTDCVMAAQTDRLAKDARKGK